MLENDAFGLVSMIFNFLLFFICVHVCLLPRAVSTEARRGCQLPWNWSQEWLRIALHGYWDQNYGPLQDQQALVITKSLLFPYFHEF